MNTSQVDQVFACLRDLAANALREGQRGAYNDCMDALYEIEEWKNGGMKGEIPVDLSELKKVLCQGLSSNAQSEPAPQTDTHQDVSPSSSGLSSQEEARQLLDAGLQALDEEDVLTAISAFRTARTIGSGSVAFEAREWLAVAELRRTSRAYDLLSRARVARIRGDPQNEVEAYREVLRLDPENEEAKQGLSLAAKQRAVTIDHLQAVEEVRQLLKSPGRQLSDIEKGLLKAQVLLGEELDLITERKVGQWYAEGRRERADLLTRIGQAETIAAMENYAEAIAKYEELYADGYLEIEIDGTLGSTYERLSQLHKEYRDFCHTKAEQYYDRAESFMPSNPRAAAHILQQALDEFTYMPEADHTRLQQRLAELRDTIECWDRARALVDNAYTKASPQERLRLLQLAQNAYPAYDSIIVQVMEAKKDVANQIYGWVDDKYRRARLALHQEDYQAAEVYCVAARQRARDLADSSPELSKLLKKIDGLLEEIEQRYAREPDVNITESVVKLGSVEREPARTHPKVFISYSWDDDIHKAWVREFAVCLRADGVDVTLDQWETAPGDQLPEFMERAIRDNDYVLIVCTPRYRTRSDSRKGGVGYEGDIMAAEVFTTQNNRKFIPILRLGMWEEASPSRFLASYYLDFRDDPYSKQCYNLLLDTIYGVRPVRPVLGPIPARYSGQSQEST